MSSKESDAEREFLISGAKAYLDAEDALAEFRRQIEDKCAQVCGNRMAEIAQACQMSWSPEDLASYREKLEGEFYIGKKLEVRGFGGVYFGLDLYREEGTSVCLALAFLYTVPSFFTRSRSLRIDETQASRLICGPASRRLRIHADIV